MPDRDVRILRVLREAEGPALLSAIADDAACSIDEASNALAALQEAGYSILRHPHLGIKLDRSPDRLIADDLLARLEGVGLAQRILVFEKTGSTSDVAAQLAREGAPEGTVVFAESQTAGRGRLGRTWESASHDGLWFSVVLRPRVAARSWIRFTTWAAVAAADAIEPFVPRPVQIKWPNDLLIDGQKVTGILLEGHHQGNDGFLIAGLGVNVNQTDFPDGLRLPATSLRVVAGAQIDRMTLAATLLRRMNALYDTACRPGGELAGRAWERSSIRGAEVELVGGGDSIRGSAIGLDEEGALQLRMADGSRRVVATGEVSVRKV